MLNKEKTKELRIINGDDIIQNVCRTLNLENVKAPTSYEEVYKRNRVYGALLAQPKLRETIKNFFPSTGLPHNETEFLKFYFNPNPERGFRYFKELTALAQLFQQSDECEWLQQIGKEILETVPKLQAKEEIAAQIVRDAIEKATRIQGELTLTFDRKLKKVEVMLPNGKAAIDEKATWEVTDAKQGYVSGCRKNFYGLHYELQVSMPKWIDRRFWQFIGLYRWYKSKKVEEVNRINKQNFYKDYVFGTVPGAIKEDIQNALIAKILSQPDFEEAFPFDRYRPSQPIEINIFFSYDGGSLQISILDIMVHGDLKNDLCDPIDFSYCDLVNQSREELSDLSRKFAKTNREKKYRNNILKRVHTIPSVNNMLAATMVEIPANETERKFRFTGVSHLYRLPKVVDTFTEGDLYREKIVPLIVYLKSMIDPIEKLISISESWKLPLTTPTVVADKNIVSFDKIYPIHLIGRKNVNGKEMKAKDLKAIKNLPTLNGQLVGLTGQNAGGKTVCHETIIYNIFLAQAGLPIFGSNFVFNPKELLGTLFLERGEGSTMQMQIRNTKHILEEIDRVAPVSALVVLDEVGTGTSHDAGVDYGRKVLEAIAKRKVSCIFTTQLSEVAEYAGRELNALNYQLDKHHKIKEGIGKPDLSELLKAEGMGPYLN